MKQGAGSSARPPAGARVRVIRGKDARAVARAVRETTEDGIALPTGPYRYPYAAVCALLRNAGLYRDPGGDTATDPVLSRDALADGLRELLARGTVVGVPLGDRLDAASARMLGDFAAMAQLAAEQGLEPGALVLGTLGEPPEPLRFSNADIRDVDAAHDPEAQLSPDAQHVLRLLAGAPHPVSQGSLRMAAGITGTELQTALVELGAAEMAEVGERIGLGPGAKVGEPSAEWLATPEVRLPLAALSISRDAQLARHLGNACLQRGDHESAVFCFALSGVQRAADAISCGRALAGAGRLESAREIYEQLEPEELPKGETLALGMLGVQLFEHGLANAARVDRLLKRVNNVAARAWRARLMIAQGGFDGARNVLRRTTREGLEREARAVRIEHELALVACLRNGQEFAKADRKLTEISALCVTRAEKRRLGTDSAHLAALDLDAHGLRACGGGAVLKDVLKPTDAPPASVRTPQGLFASLRAHGATLLAALEGELLVVVPPGALARPGLAAQVRGKLRRMRECPHAFSFGSEEFDGLGPFSGCSMLALHRKSGPMFVLFRPGRVPDVSRLLKDMGEA